jgi:hypothetical protein
LSSNESFRDFGQLNELVEKRSAGESLGQLGQEYLQELQEQADGVREWKELHVGELKIWPAEDVNASG